MNQLILDLADKAAYDVPGTFMNIPDEFCEKFAALIVAECTGVLNKRFMGDLNREDIEVRRCIEDVKKHFGVNDESI